MSNLKPVQFLKNYFCANHFNIRSTLYLSLSRLSTKFPNPNSARKLAELHKLIEFALITQVCSPRLPFSYTMQPPVIKHQRCATSLMYHLVIIGVAPVFISFQITSSSTDMLQTRSQPVTKLVWRTDETSPCFDFLLIFHAWVCKVFCNTFLLLDKELCGILYMQAFTVWCPVLLERFRPTSCMMEKVYFPTLTCQNP